MFEIRRYFFGFTPSWTAMRPIASKLKHALFGTRYFLAFPPWTAMRLIASKLKLRKSQSGELVEFPVSDCICPALRAKTHDIDIFEQIFLLRDCEVKLQAEPRFIVDAGAHIGCSALFFASSFPRANVAAIEADPGNYQLLLRNTRDHQRIRAIHAAVWHRPESVVIANEQDDPWSFQIKSADGQCTTIQGMTVSAIISECGFEKIDLLKLDIEGAEREIFEAGDLDWMNRTDAIMIELHDRFRPGCEAAFLDAARRFRFEITQRNFHNIVAQRT
jgi:FkbM family methyltransferase